MGDQTYKYLKEQFVSNHEGTSVIEIAFIVSSAPLAVLLRRSLMIWIFSGEVLPSG